MQQIRFGQTGLRVSKLCLGTMGIGSSAWKGWVLDEDRFVPILQRALDLGFTFFDMADWYSAGRNEEVVARNLLKLTRRDDLVLATKVFYPDERDPRTTAGCRASTSSHPSIARCSAWGPTTSIST